MNVDMTLSGKETSMGVKRSIVERLRGDVRECDVDCKAEKLTRAARDWAALSVWRIR